MNPSTANQSTLNQSLAQRLQHVIRHGLYALMGMVLALGLAIPAHAGRGCEEAQPLKVQTLQNALNLAMKTKQALDASGAQVVLLARAGQDLQEYGLHYSHFGFAYRHREEDGSTMWRVIHKLNTCGTAESAVYRQGLGDFYLDDLWRFEAGWVEPTPQVQERLLAVLERSQLATHLHQKAYNMLAYPWSQKYQQSNQWALETLAMAMGSGDADGDDGRIQAQIWLRSKGYQPSVLEIGMFKRLGARITRANIAFDDHPNDKRFSGHIETVTVDSVFGWLQKASLTEKPMVTLY